MATPATIELDAQYRALRENAGLLDRSARGKLAVRGSDAVDYLQGQLTNDIEALDSGEGCYAALLDRKGHLQADLRALRIAEQEVWLDTQPATADRLRTHLGIYKIGRQVEIVDLGEQCAILSVIGPGAFAAAGTAPLRPEHAHRELELAGVSCRAVATDLGLDLIAESADAERVRAALVERGAVEVSEAAAEILRVESGRPRFGAEMTEATMPAEAGIADRAVSFTKGCYIGQEPVARLHYKGRPNRHLRGLRLEAQATAGAVIRSGEREVGRVGTACLSPALGALALAVVRREVSPGDRVSVGEEGIAAEVVELPF